MDLSQLHQRAREQGVQPLVYWLVRAVLQPFFHLYFRLSRIGREHVPDDGPYIVAANHRSFLDPFVIATIARRPLYYVAKRELFEKRWQGWLLNALGAFPVDRGTGDEEMLKTARAILARGDSVLIFPEGTRIRPGSLGRPRRGVGRLALETGVPVVPVAVIGTENVRRKWRIRPHKVRIRIGRPLTFPSVETPSPELAAAVTDRIWPCVMLQWEWLGGLPPLRRATVLGNGTWAEPMTTMLLRAGLQVDRDPLEIEREDLVVLTEPIVPLAVTEAIAPRAGVLFAGGVAEVPQARTASLATVAGAPEETLIIATEDRGLGRQLREVFAVAGREATVDRDRAVSHAA
jgi:glycerol-3-phosphate dehydrogenase (NAD(P)+)